MTGCSLTRFPDDVALATSVADLWLDQIGHAERTGAAHRVALAGGRITRRFLAIAADRARARGLSLDGVDFFWGDERCVSTEDAESNFRLAWETLLEPAGVPESRIHRVLGELDPGAAAALAEQEIRRVMGVFGDAMPVLDLVFLGMGEDAHVASLFPGAAVEVTDSRCVYVGTTGPKSPPQRVSLTYRAIAAAREVWVLASGAGKQAALEQSMSPVPGAEETPLGRVLRERSTTRIFTDIAGV